MSLRPPVAMIVATHDAARFYAGLVLARCEIALGGEARLFMQGTSVALLVAGAGADDDERYAAAGEPTLDQLRDEALTDGVHIVACQSGLAISAISSDQLDDRIAIGGMIGFLTAVSPEARLIML